MSVKKKLREIEAELLGKYAGKIMTAPASDVQLIDRIGKILKTDDIDRMTHLLESIQRSEEASNSQF